mgnify:FL=1
MRHRPHADGKLLDSTRNRSKLDHQENMKTSTRNNTRNRTERSPRDISREMILRCAVGLFERKGIDETSVNDIVARARIAKGTFYLYYKNKDDLINAVMETYGQEFLREVVEKNRDLAKIVHFSRSIVDFFTARPLFLTELRKNLNRGKDLASIDRLSQAFAHIIGSYLNLNERYPIHQLDVYSDIIMSTILEICHKLIVERSIQSEDEALMMLQDFLKRFFDCEQFFS